MFDPETNLATGLNDVLCLTLGSASDELVDFLTY